MTSGAMLERHPGEATLRRRIAVRGVVQGVGFRPFVYRSATRLGLAGWVGNTQAGVLIEVEGDALSLDAFVAGLRDDAPPNAAIDGLDIRAIPQCRERGFAIRDSLVAAEPAATIPPDLAICADCLAELFDPSDRRYRYPFTNCTNCGPRYSIIEDLPYDRERTAMRRFAMCPACAAEYRDPADRRFHAEPNACPACGPQLALWDRAGRAQAERDDALILAAAALRAGRILALKGLGGFQLIADARNAAALGRLRQRKHRPDKPFAVMFAALDDIAGHCAMSDAEGALLQGREAPIVLLRRRPGANLAQGVAPGNPWLGAILPTTPLHHLLLRELGVPVVATSGNVADEPIVADEADALQRLGGIADLFLVHDRPIVRPIDDSVARIVAGRAMLLRRARGYAPLPVAAPASDCAVLALGGQLKNTVALTVGDRAIISQHLGDLGTPAGIEAFRRAAADLTRLYRAMPAALACDLHPDYAATRYAEALGLPVVAVQHHVAHIAAAMAEHGLSGPLLGIAWDGAGYGDDGTVWGGEFLRLAGAEYRRIAHFRQFRLPGGERAMREPRRAALAVLYEIFGADAFTMQDLPPVAAFSPAERKTLKAMIEHGVNAPLTSSAGRLFDAVAALLDLCQTASYEGQAAIGLEWAADTVATDASYCFPLRREGGDAPAIIDWAPALRAVVEDRRNGVMAGRIAAAFHNGLVEAIIAVARQAGEQTIVLSGGCFQNAYLTERAIARLRREGFSPYWSRQVPPNDGGLSLGQAIWARRLLDREGEN